MTIHARRLALRIFLAAAATLGMLGGRAFATGVPIDGFLPMVGISLTREFVDDILPIAPVPSTTMSAPQLGLGGVAHYDVALLDTGAAVSIISSASRAAFGIDNVYAGQGGEDGFTGAGTITIGGATGFVEGDVLDMMGLYAGGLQTPTRVPGPGPLVLNASGLHGQTNTSIVAVPPESDLPNVLGLSFISQYATRIRADQPQIFTLDNQTVRTPAIEFFPRGSGGMGIVRKAPLTLQGESPVTPQHVPNYEDPERWLEMPWEDPLGPTFVSGGLFLNIDVEDDLAGDGDKLDNIDFFFDTGASVTVVSEFNAFQLGFDVTHDEPEFTIAVVGSAGTKLDVPGFFVDKFTIQAIGGSIVATHVPVVVLDIVDPSDPNNIIDGFVGTNLLSGRNLVVDPNPAISGGPSAGLYISDTVTMNSNWSSASASASWSTAASWSAVAEPGTLTIANVRWVAGAHQTAVVSGNATAWEVNVSGVASDHTMTVSVPSGAKLTTFTGLNIEQHGAVALAGGTLDVQYVDIRDGGRLSGSGFIATGSGPIPGQVENVSGVVAPSVGMGVLNIEGRYSNGPEGVLEISITGLTAGTQYARLAVDGPVTLAGSLKVLLPGAIPFVPALGAAFTILTASDGLGGEFDVLDLPGLPAGRAWYLGYEDAALLLKVTIPGDFNGDFTVDAADLTEWRAGESKYSSADFLVWQRNLGASISPIAGVPEPAALALMVSASFGVAGARRKRWG